MKKQDQQFIDTLNAPSQPPLDLIDHSFEVGLYVPILEQNRYSSKPSSPPPFLDKSDNSGEYSLSELSHKDNESTKQQRISLVNLNLQKVQEENSQHGSCVNKQSYFSEESSESTSSISSKIARENKKNGLIQKNASKFTNKINELNSSSHRNNKENKWMKQIELSLISTIPKDTNRRNAHTPQFSPQNQDKNKNIELLNISKEQCQNEENSNTDAQQQKLQTQYRAKTELHEDAQDTNNQIQTLQIEEDDQNREKNLSLEGGSSLLSSQRKSLTKEKQKGSEDEFDSFSVKMNSVSKRSILLSGIGDPKSGEIAEIKIAKDAFPQIQRRQKQETSLKLDFNNSKLKFFRKSLVPWEGDTSKRMSESDEGSPSKSNYLFSIANLKKSVRTLVSKSPSRKRLKEVTQKQIALIGDLAIIFESDYQAEKVKQAEQYLSQCLQQYFKIPTINPLSKGKLIWDIFAAIVMVFFFFIIPIIMATKQSLNTLFGDYPFYLLIIFLVLDSFANANTGYYENGNLVTNKLRILSLYFHKIFIADIVSIIPIIIYFFYTSGYPLLILYFVKYTSVKHIFRRIEVRLDLKPSLLNTIAMFRLLFTVLFIAHIFANIWLALPPLHPQQNWMHKAQVIDQTWQIQYMTAFYFITVTMVTVGYGDITPNNNIEIFFSIITIFFACAVFAYSVNAIGFILQEINKQTKELTNNLSVINAYMTKKNISTELRFQVKEYLEYFWKRLDVGNLELENKIISQLAHDLREKLFVEANKLLLKENTFFPNKFSKDTLLKTLKIVKEVHFTPQQIIFSRGTNDDNAIYFIENGNVELFVQGRRNNKDIQIKKLGKGEYFGDIEFYTGQERSMSVKSIDFATVLKIEREEFLLLLKSFTKDEEVFHLQKDEVLFGKKYGENGAKCFGCDKGDHLLSGCSMVQHVPNKLQCYKRHNFNPGQTRLKYSRGHREKCSTRKDIDLLSNAGERIQEDFKDLIPQSENSSQSEDLSQTNSTFSSSDSSSQSEEEENNFPINNNNNNMSPNHINNNNNINYKNVNSNKKNSINIKSNNYNINLENIRRRSFSILNNLNRRQSLSLFNQKLEVVGESTSVNEESEEGSNSCLNQPPNLMDSMIIQEKQDSNTPLQIKHPSISQDKRISGDKRMSLPNIGQFLCTSLLNKQSKEQLQPMNLMNAKNLNQLESYSKSNRSSVLTNHNDIKFRSKRRQSQHFDQSLLKQFNASNKCTSLRNSTISSSSMYANLNHNNMANKNQQVQFSQFHGSNQKKKDSINNRMIVQQLPEIIHNQEIMVSKINQIYSKMYELSPEYEQNDILELDAYKEYEYYFPLFNLSAVLQKCRSLKKAVQLSRIARVAQVTRTICISSTSNHNISLFNIDEQKKGSMSMINSCFNDDLPSGMITSRSPTRNKSFRNGTLINTPSHIRSLQSTIVENNNSNEEKQNI